MLFKNSSLSWFVVFLTIIIDNNVCAAVPNLNIAVQNIANSTKHIITSNWLFCILLWVGFCVFVEHENIANKRFSNMFLFCLPVVMIFCIWLIFAT